MFETSDGDSSELVEAMDAAHVRVSAAERELFGLIAEIDRAESWRDRGARDTVHFLSMRYGISLWKAHRWLVAAHALEGLPGLSDAFSRGELGVDKTVELARFASSSTEGGLIRWAQEVAVSTIRHRGDLEVRRSSEEITEIERSRSVSWWYSEEGRRFGLEADLPAHQGAIVVQAIERLAEAIPVMPDEDGEDHADARRADALVALCSARLAHDADPDRATVVVHTRLERLLHGGGSETASGAVLDPESVARLLCNARTQVVVGDEGGTVVGLGRMTREPSAWMVRQVRYRDRGCRFPGCGTRAFTQAHHIRFWRNGGRTDLNNLLLICSFHHRVVHEHGWSVRRDPAGELHWSRADGTRYHAGPSPGLASDHPLPVAAAV